jgi:hypothetical protein
MHTFGSVASYIVFAFINPVSSCVAFINPLLHLSILCYTLIKYDIQVFISSHYKLIHSSTLLQCHAFLRQPVACGATDLSTSVFVTI